MDVAYVGSRASGASTVDVVGRGRRVPLERCEPVDPADLPFRWGEDREACLGLARALLSHALVEPEVAGAFVEEFAGEELAQFGAEWVLSRDEVLAWFWDCLELVVASGAPFPPVD